MASSGDRNVVTLYRWATTAVWNVATKSKAEELGDGNDNVEVRRMVELSELERVEDRARGEIAAIVQAAKDTLQHPDPHSRSVAYFEHVLNTFGFAYSSDGFTDMAGEARDLVAERDSAVGEAEKLEDRVTLLENLMRTYGEEMQREGYPTLARHMFEQAALPGGETRGGD